MPITVRDIARIANVSQGTVDRALHNRSDISQDTKRKILFVANQLNYTPNRIARALVKRRGLSIAMIGRDTTRDSFWFQLQIGAKMAACELEKAGVKSYWITLQKLDIKEQRAAVEKLITNKIDAIALAPRDPNRLTEVINKAVEEDIPVLTFNVDAPNSQRMCFVGQDSLTAGRVAGQLMAEFTGHSGTLAIVTAAGTSSADILRLQGFIEEIEGHFPKMEIVGIYKNKNAPEAYVSTRKLLRRHSSLKGIYVAAGGSFGVGSAVEDAGRVGTVKVFCFDLFKETIELIRKGVVQITIEQDPFFQGYQPLKILYNYLLTNQKPLQEFLFTSISVVCRANLEPLVTQYRKNLEITTTTSLKKVPYSPGVRIN